MLNFIKRSLCHNCIFYNAECDRDNCKHYYIAQNIISRDGSLFAIDMSSRPRRFFEKTTSDYFDKISATDGKRLVQHQLVNIDLSFHKMGVGTDILFLNIDRYIFLDDLMVLNLIEISKRLRLKGKTIVFELTDRYQCIEQLCGSVFYRLILEDVLFAATDTHELQMMNLELSDYAYIKINIEEVNLGLSRNFNKFVDGLYCIKEFGAKLIVDKVKSKNDFLLAYNLPFDYFQGLYVSEFNTENNEG